MRKNEGNENRIYQNSIQNSKFELRILQFWVTNKILSEIRFIRQYHNMSI